MSTCTCADVGSFIESKTSVVQTSNVGFTSEVSDYLVLHTGPGPPPVSFDAQCVAVNLPLFTSDVVVGWLVA